jgi:hypothetical protein
LLEAYIVVFDFIWMSQEINKTPKLPGVQCGLIGWTFDFHVIVACVQISDELPDFSPRMDHLPFGCFSISRLKRVQGFE